MADTEKLNEEVERLIEYLRKFYEATGRPVAEFKNLEESVRKQVASGKNVNEVLEKLAKTTSKYDSFLNRLNDTSDRYDKIVKSGTIGYQVLNEQLKRGTVGYKEAFETIRDTTRNIERLERQLEALEIEKNLTDPLDNAALALKQTEIEAARAAIADLKKAETALKFTASFKGVQSQLVVGFKQIPEIVLGVMKKGLMDHASMAVDPIGTASNVMTGAMSIATKGLQGLASIIPVVGAGLSKLVGVASEAAQTAVQFLAQELKVTAESMKTLASQGASFGGGLTEIRQIAVESGLNLQMFSNIMKNSRENILAMGMSGGEGAKQIAAVSKAMKTQLGPSGRALREELMAMGFSYEEQGEIQAQYMAQLKASGKDLRNLAPSELAIGTREYAKNLKVISDITGQDAKKLMERARAESMRGALMSKLTDEQRKAFTNAHSTLAGLGPEFQNALVQMLAGGVVTDPIIAANKEAMDMIKKITSNVQTGNANIISDTQQAMSEAAEATRERTKTEGSAVDTAAALSKNLNGTVMGLAETENKLARFTLATNAAEKSAKAAEDQASTTDKATEGFISATKASIDFSNKMTDIATKALPNFGTALEKTIKTMETVLGIAFGAFGGKTTTEKESERIKSLPKPEQAVELRSQRATSGLLKDLLAMPTDVRAEEIKKYKFSDEQKASLMIGEMPKMATGGIASRPSIAGEAGPEAVIPLPDGKTVPVSMDFSSFIKSLNEVRDLMKMQLEVQKSQGNSMLDKLDESINTQRRLLENSF